MKKCRILSTAAALILAAGMAAAPVFADETVAPAGETTPVTGETTLASEATEPTEMTIPPHGTGDTSVSMGSHSVDAANSVAGPVDYMVEAKGVTAYEIKTDTLVYANNADTRLYPASLVKVMSCLVASELADPEEIITVDGDLVSYVQENGLGVDLQDGEKMPMKDLLYCMMVESADDASVVIAAHLAGSEEAFVALMNQKARELGCRDTNFVNCHGMHDEQQYTTCRDMTKIVMEGLKDPLFRELFGETYITIPATNLSEERTLVTTNYLMSEAVTQNYYDSRVTGGRTGYTTPAGRCLITLAESRDMEYIIVMMGAQISLADDGYSVVEFGNFEETIGLMNFLFNGYMPTQVLSRNQVLDQFPVEGGLTDTNGCTRRECSTIVPVGSDLASLRYEFELDHGGVHAPVQAGDSIGVVRVWFKTKCAAQEELYSSISVERQTEENTRTLVNPAVAAQEHSSLWDKVLVVILSLLAALGFLSLVIWLRNMRLRAIRRKRREAKRRRQKNRA